MAAILHLPESQKLNLPTNTVECHSPKCIEPNDTGVFCWRPEMLFTELDSGCGTEPVSGVGKEIPHGSGMSGTSTTESWFA